MSANCEEFVMKSSHKAARRGLFAAFAVCAAGGATVAALSAPSAATAASDPCAASEVARTVGSVVTSMGSYLDSHPQTNQALTTVSQQQGGPQSLVALKTYFDANPQVQKDMQALQAPLTDLSGRCKLPVTIPQVLGLLQNAQGGLQPSPATAVVQGTGPLPGPAAVMTR
jgi:heme-binding protein